MYYRVASQEGQSPTWQWKSTVLSSLESLFHFLRLNHALSTDHLHVFSSPSHEGLDEQLICENNGLGSTSVTAAQFLQERMFSLQGITPEVSMPVAQEHQQPASIGVITNGLLNEASITVQAMAARGASPLEARRVELKRGAGGDHDLPYTFTLPHAWPRVRSWMRLLVKVHNGKFQL
jgi:hypothetical protein